VAAVLEAVGGLDAAAASFAESLRWGPLTLVFLLASTWWVKWPLIAAIGACGDCACRRRRPRAFAAGLLAIGTAALLVTILKQTFDRPRPPIADPTLDPIGIVPASASFPSGHAATAFAAAVAIGLVHPRLRRPLLALAAVVALSRVYLGVHYVLDVLAGTVLGIAVGIAAARVVRVVAPEPTAPALHPVPLETSSAPSRRSPG
jgi:undecaprenyl-diphosphatase